MNLKDVEYIVKISEEKNLTIAAEKLFITPSALNQQILNLERSIGTPLFNRTRNGWTPTEAGTIYIKNAKEMLRLKQETLHQLQDIAQIQRGTLTVGFPPERGSRMFTRVYPIFHAKYPDIIINVIETSVHNQQQLISQGNMDIGFMTLEKKQCTDDVYIPIFKEELLLAIPKNHSICENAKKEEGSKYPILDLSLLQKEPFALLYKGSTITECLNNIFKDYNFTPNVLFQATRACTILEMVNASLCCSIIPDTNYDTKMDNVALFSLPNHPKWEIMASYRKNSYLSRPARYFIELATKHWLK